ncbi:hypothetical protein B0H15DRAFT_55355 [Mycena belliarum]|uniref:DUF6534 domain-containing protein n=1 Tax=Mycena belliarum TaxID=1033014 RepID=A0AAD6UA24_9AGAR|nr:hypothetical protein B0H15DRAFT_55355 [Mycena belliae]
MASTAPPIVIPIPPNIGSIAASQLIGSLLNYCLYGVLAVQVYVYRLSFPNDKASIKWMVYLIFLTETVLTALNGYDMYNWFAKGFGDILQFGQPGLSPYYTPIMGSVMALVVQLFFCYRIYIIKREALPLSIFIALVSTLQAAGGIGGGAAAFLSKNDEHDHIRVVFVYIWLIGDAIADVFIAGTMSYLLMRASRNQHKQTNDIVKRIVRLTIETNALSTFVAIISLILFFGTPNTTYFICPTMVLAKLYANTLLVTFNNRAFVHQAGGSRAGTGHSASVNDSYAPRSGSRKSMPFSAGLGLDSETDTFTGASSVGGYGGKVTVTTHSVSDSYNLGTLQDPHPHKSIQF